MDSATLNSVDRLWLALNIYHEARSEPLEGQIAVGHVTLNRVEFRRRSVKRVVLQAYQFSWANHGARPDIDEYEAIERAFRAVDLVIEERRQGKDFFGCDHYFADYIDPPRWARGMMFHRQIGRHLFYYRG